MTQVVSFGDYSFLKRKPVHNLVTIDSSDVYGLFKAIDAAVDARNEYGKNPSPETRGDYKFKLDSVSKIWNALKPEFNAIKVTDGITNYIPEMFSTRTFKILEYHRFIDNNGYLYPLELYNYYVHNKTFLKLKGIGPAVHNELIMFLQKYFDMEDEI